MNDITLFSNVPAHLRDTELSATTKALMSSASSVKRISIKGGVFRLMHGGKEIAQIEDRHMDVIIVRAAPAVSRQYYAGAYDGNAQAAPPDCWSNDGEKPDAASKNRQSDTCAKCPQNIAGSGNGNSRACRYQQRLAVMLPDDMESGVYQLTLPSTSIFGKAEGGKRPLKDYVTYLAAQTKPVNVDSLVTRMKFDTSVEAPKVHFAPVRWLSDAEYTEAKAGGESEDAQRAVTMTVAAVDGAAVSKPAPMEIEGERPGRKAPKEYAADSGEEVATEEVKAKPGRKPKAQPEAEVEADEPEKRKAAAKPESVPKKPSRLASVVAEWDDE
jgi:hypothetical protein